MTFTARVSEDPEFTVVRPADNWTEDEVALFLTGWLDRDVPEPMTAGFDSAAHPHAPAGSPAGGQFTPTDTGQSTKTQPAEKTQPAKKTPKKRKRRKRHIPAGKLGFDGQHGTGYGMRHGDPRVKSLQTELNRLGLTDSHGKKLDVDGKLGPLTTSSIEKAQRALGIKPADGIVDQAFIDKLKATKTLPPKKVVHHRAKRKPMTAAADVQTGAMIALIPTDRDARRLAVPGGEPLDELHLTLMYLGKADDWSFTERVALEIQLETYLDILAPVDGEGFAIAIFNPPGNGRDDGMDRDTCLVELCSGSALAVVHNYVTRGVRDVETLPPIPAQHSPWIPHVTLTYTQDMELAPKLTALTGPITFDRVRVAFAGEHHDIELQGTLTASALG